MLLSYVCENIDNYTFRYGHCLTVFTLLNNFMMFIVFAWCLYVWNFMVFITFQVL